MKSMSREEIRRVIEGKGEGLRVPILYDFGLEKKCFMVMRPVETVAGTVSEGYRYRFFRYAGKYGRACGRS